MVLAHLYVWCSLFTIFCNFPICSPGNPGSSSNDNVQALNNILKADRWVLLVELALKQNLKVINGEALDVSDLLHTGPDGNIVTPENYTDKLIKSSTTVNCIYSESVRSITGFVIFVIMPHCMKLTTGEQMLDCTERFWQTIDLAKSIFENMLKILYFFYNSSSNLCPRTVIEVLELLIPHYDRQKYNSVNYLNNDGTVKVDDFQRDSDIFLEKITDANISLQDFIKARCMPDCVGANERTDILGRFEAGMDHISTDTIFEYFNNCLNGSEQMFLPDLGFNID